MGDITDEDFAELPITWLGAENSNSEEFWVACGHISFLVDNPSRLPLPKKGDVARVYGGKEIREGDWVTGFAVGDVTYCYEPEPSDDRVDRARGTYAKRFGKPLGDQLTRVRSSLEKFGALREDVLAVCNAVEDQATRADEAETKLNTPELHDFARGVVLEAAHQRARWGSEHDAGKTPANWFWLVGYLAGKALRSHIDGLIAPGDGEPTKALHHTITAAAALANWHSAILGKTDMRPGLPAEKLPKELANG